MTKEQEAIARIMKGLKCSEAEAREVYEADRAIDKGEKMEFDLTKEQNKIAQKFAHTGTKKPTVYNFKQKTRKENPTKAGIISALAEFLEQYNENICENVEIVNKERIITFKINENQYELNLKQKRKPKE